MFVFLTPKAKIINVKQKSASSAMLEVGDKFQVL
jgi:hypothetical protein